MILVSLNFATPISEYDIMFVKYLAVQLFRFWRSTFLFFVLIVASFAFCKPATEAPSFSVLLLFAIVDKSEKRNNNNKQQIALQNSMHDSRFLFFSDFEVPCRHPGCRT